MPRLRRTRICPSLLVAFCLMACSSGGGDDNDVFVPLTNIDLDVTEFQVSPGEADPEDVLTLSGTIVNQGTETANPLQGDSFLVRFNLSRDGTFELNEIGFLEVPISDPIPPGASHQFSFPGSLMNGDTLEQYGDFCTSVDCTPPEIGVIGVWVDALEEIAENDAVLGNNFKFTTLNVVGTNVTAPESACDFGELGGFGDPGCDLVVNDGTTVVRFHAPERGVIFRNQLRSSISATVIVRGCLDCQAGTGVCGGSFRIVASTVKTTGASILQAAIPCSAVGAQCPDAACSISPSPFTIRDPSF